MPQILSLEVLMVVDLLDFESSLAGSLTSSTARVALCVSTSGEVPELFDACRNRRSLTKFGFAAMLYGFMHNCRVRARRVQDDKVSCDRSREQSRLSSRQDAGQREGYAGRCC